MIATKNFSLALTTFIRVFYPSVSQSANHAFLSINHGIKATTPHKQIVLDGFKTPIFVRPYNANINIFETQKGRGEKSIFTSSKSSPPRIHVVVSPFVMTIRLMVSMMSVIPISSMPIPPRRISHIPHIPPIPSVPRPLIASSTVHIIMLLHHRPFRVIMRTSMIGLPMACGTTTTLQRRS